MGVQLSQALAGTVVLVTADRRSGDLSSALGRHGASIKHAPSLSIVPHIDDARLIAATRELIANPPDIVVVTTGIGFRGWLETADAAGLSAELGEVLAKARLVARGPKARGAIQQAGFQPDFVADSETSAEVAAHLKSVGVRGRRVAVQHHGAGSDGLDELLTAAGADVASLVVYRWGPPPDPTALARSVAEAARGDVDAVVFTSAPGAAAWLDSARHQGLLDELVRRCAAGTLVAAAVGPVTAGPLQDAGLSPIWPERGRLGSLIRTLVAHFESLADKAIPTVAGPLLMRSTAVVLNGEVRAITPGPMGALQALVAAQGQVVSRDDVLDALPGTSRDPHAAEVTIARLRDALGTPELVQTVVRRGYRLALDSA